MSSTRVRLAVVGTLLVLNLLVWLPRARPKHRPATHGSRSATQFVSTAAPKEMQRGPHLGNAKQDSTLSVVVSSRQDTQRTLGQTLDLSGGPDCVAFKQAGITKLRRATVKLPGAQPTEFLDFCYYDPHPAYKREVHVRMPQYYSLEKRTLNGWNSRFRLWEVKPAWSECEWLARANRVNSGSRYAMAGSTQGQLPDSLLETSGNSSEKLVASVASVVRTQAQSGSR